MSNSRGQRQQWNRATRDRLAELYGCRCFYCGMNLTYAGVHLDHVVPLACGGEDLETNLVPSCVLCNSAKSAENAEDFAGRRVEHVDGRWRLGARTALLTRAEKQDISVRLAVIQVAMMHGASVEEVEQAVHEEMMWHAATRRSA